MPDQEYDQQQDWGKVAESAFVFLVFTGAGVIIGLLLCRPSAAGLTQSTSGLQVVINDSTTTAEVGVGQELTYVIEGATPDGLVSIIIQDTPAPIQPDASATETTANADGYYSGTITGLSIWEGYPLYVYAYDRSTDTASSNYVVLTTKAPIASPAITLLDTSLTAPGTIDWTASSITPNGAYEITSPVSGTPETGYASESGGATGSISIPSGYPPGNYSVTVRDVTTDLSASVQFTVS